LLLSLKGLTSSDDFIRTQTEGMVRNQSSQLPVAFTLTD